MDSHQSVFIQKDLMQKILPSDILLTEFIADGGQGVVFKGTYKGILSAVKLYYPGQLDKRIHREVEALSSIKSEFIVKLLFHGNTDYNGNKIEIVVTEFIEGIVLSDLINHHVLCCNELNVLTKSVCSAIETLWKLRIVHRDLKPNNIIIRTNGMACVIDLGIARHLSQSTLTALGYFGGTFGYMSPEQIKAVKQLTCKSDIYSLGIILLEASMGKHPTDGDQLRFFASKFNLNLPESIKGWENSELVKKMLNPQPINRPRPDYILNNLK